MFLKMTKIDSLFFFGGGGQSTDTSSKAFFKLKPFFGSKNTKLLNYEYFFSGENLMIGPEGVCSLYSTRQIRFGYRYILITQPQVKSLRIFV